MVYEPSCHGFDHCRQDEHQAFCGKPLEVLCQTSDYIKPCQPALDNPAPRQHLTANLIAFDERKWWPCAIPQFTKCPQALRRAGVWQLAKIKIRMLMYKGFGKSGVSPTPEPAIDKSGNGAHFWVIHPGGPDKGLRY